MSFNKYWTICTWSCKNLSFLGAGFLLFLPGMIWGAGDTVLSAKPEEQFLININTGAENVTRITEKKYAAKEAGDNAFAAGDFGVAASFYRKYREDAV